MNKPLPTVEEGRPEVFNRYGLRPQLPEVFDNSVSNTFRRCERLAYYRYILGRRPTKVSAALNFGSAWHAMQETLVKEGDIEAALAEADKHIPEEVDDRYGRTRHRAKEGFIQWLEKYAEADAQLIEIVRVEQSADVYCPPDGDCHYGGCNLHYGGRLDRLIRMHNRLWVMDFKTSTYSDSNFHEKLILDSQSLGYIWLATHLTGERVWGTVIDRALINKSSLDFTRYPLPVGDAHVREWIETERRTQEAIRSRFEESPHQLSAWVQNSDECFKYGRCRYFDVCAVPAFPDVEARLQILDSEYEEDRWNFFNID